MARLGVLAIGCGLAAGALMLAFRGLFEFAQALFLPGADPENYEALGMAARLALPIAGGIVVGVLFQFLSPATRDVGPAHVLDALKRGGSRLPLRNALAQWLGATLSIIAGHSVGREGPAIHLGAACGSLVGQRFGLAERELRVLVACGVAAAIAASFNTPLAGVVLAMEVIVTEYTVAGFAPVILAAVSATAVTRVFYGAQPAFEVPPLALRSLWELPYIVGVGALIGALSAAYTALLVFFAACARRLPFWVGCTLGGLAVAICALAAPEVMGIGYDTVDAALLGRIGAATLVIVALLKLLATTAGVGLGLPGGLIGPMLVIGATAGGALGIAGASLLPQLAAPSGFYALLGMGAMMAGTLQAPLAALTAMLELTGNPAIIWPGMLATIAAYAVAHEAFKQPPVFDALLAARTSSPGS
jgi:H+/Cl- antiporter ClcA